MKNTAQKQNHVFEIRPHWSDGGRRKNFDAQRCSCFNQEDKDRMLNIVHAAFGNMGAFNESVQLISSSARFKSLVRKVSRRITRTRIHGFPDPQSVYSCHESSSSESDSNDDGADATNGSMVQTSSEDGS